MSIIKRYAVWESLHEDCNGQLVAFADHEREVAALKAQLEVYTGLVTATHGVNCFALLAEGNLCTCGYIYKVMVRGEQALRVKMTEDRNRHALKGVDLMRQRDEFAKRVQDLEEVLVLAEHKIDQYLQGQYPGGNSLGHILKAIRVTLAGTKEGQ